MKKMLITLVSFLFFNALLHSGQEGTLRGRLSQLRQEAKKLQKRIFSKKEKFVDTLLSKMRQEGRNIDETVLFEMISQVYFQQYGVKSINLLIPNTFGPGDDIDPNKTHALNGMIIRMIKAKMNKSDEFEIWGSGNPVREWAYVDDVADILHIHSLFAWH